MTTLSLHPSNTGFTWQHPSWPCRSLTGEQLDAYDRQGFLVLERLLDDDTIAALLTEIEPVQERVVRALGRRGDDAVPGFTITRALVARSPVLREFCATGPLAAIAKDLLGPRVRLFNDQAVYKHPRPASAFAWHQDNGKLFLEPQQYLTCWLALTDSTRENGCLAIAPGLHRSGTLAHWQRDDDWVCLADDPDDAIALPLRAGDAAVFSSVTTHKTYANRTGRTRKAYVVQYTPDGAVALESDGEGRVTPVPQADPERQYLIP